MQDYFAYYIKREIFEFDDIGNFPNLKSADNSIPEMLKKQWKKNHSFFINKALEHRTIWYYQPKDLFIIIKPLQVTYVTELAKELASHSIEKMDLRTVDTFSISLRDIIKGQSNTLRLDRPNQKVIRKST